MKIDRSLIKILGKTSFLIISFVTMILGALYGFNELSLILGGLGILVFVISVFFPNYSKNTTFLKYSIILGFLVTYIFTLLYSYNTLMGIVSILMIILSLLSLIA